MVIVLSHSEDLAVRVRRCLHVFFVLSGLWVNITKSLFVGVGSSLQEVQRVALEIVFQVGTLHMKYLGLHLGGRLCDCQSWNKVMEVFRAQLAIWKICHLLMGGRLILIKAILSSLPVFQMPLVILPVGIIRKLQGLMSHFLEDLLKGRSSI